VLCGSIVLAAVPLVMILRKGNRVHQRMGKVFIYCMFVVATTALFMWQKEGHLFLVFLDVVVVYLFVYGFRIVERYRNGFTDYNTRLDGALAITVIFGSMLTIWVGFAFDTVLMHQLRIVLVMLGIIGLWFGAWDLYSLLSRRLTRTGWLLLHLTAMLSAYISAVTAFIVINAHAAPMLARWLVPILVGGSVIVATQFRIRSRLTPIKTAPHSFGEFVRKYFWDIIPSRGADAPSLSSRRAGTVSGPKH
jgi:uncharacterized membrane protein